MYVLYSTMTLLLLYSEEKRPVPFYCYHHYRIKLICIIIVVVNITTIAHTTPSPLREPDLFSRNRQSNPSFDWVHRHSTPCSSSRSWIPGGEEHRSDHRVWYVCHGFGRSFYHWWSGSLAGMRVGRGWGAYCCSCLLWGTGLILRWCWCCCWRWIRGIWDERGRGFFLRPGWEGSMVSLVGGFD